MSTVTIISASLRMGSNSRALAERFAMGARDAGHDVELIDLSGKKIAFCVGCLSCQATGKCIFADDAAAIMNRVIKSDVVCWATPVYYYGMPGQMKTLIDRMNPMFPKDYKFRDIYLLAASAEDGDSACERVQQGLQGWIDCFGKAALKGRVLCGGVTGPGEVPPAKLREAYELGRNA